MGRGSVGGTVGRAVTRDVSTGGSSGTIDRDAVARVINDHMHEVQSCYERALLKEPGLSGKASLEWTIGMNGRVTQVRTKMSTLRNPSVEGCIIGAIKSWAFPHPRGGAVIISYPFIFNAVGLLIAPREGTVTTRTAAAARAGRPGRSAQLEDLENPGTATAVQDRAFRMNHELTLGRGDAAAGRLLQGLLRTGRLHVPLHRPLRVAGGARRPTATT